MTTGMKLQNIHIPSKVGFALKDVAREKNANQSKWSTHIGDPHKWSDPNFKENIIQEYKDFIIKEKEIARKVKTILGHGLTLGLKKDDLYDVATKVDDSIEATKPGAQKYRVSFGEEYIDQILSNEYPLPSISDTILRRIDSGLRTRGIDPDTDSLFSDLEKIWAQHNRIIGD
jgi:hypothetical protein